MRPLRRTGPPARGALAGPVRWLAIDTSAITAIDFSAGQALKDLQHDLLQQNVELALARVDANLRRNLDQLELTPLIRPDRIFDSRKSCWTPTAPSRAWALHPSGKPAHRLLGDPSGCNRSGTR